MEEIIRDSKGRFVKGSQGHLKFKLDYNKIKELYLEGNSMLKISKMLGFKGINSKIFKYIKSLGISRPSGFQMKTGFKLRKDGYLMRWIKGNYVFLHHYTYLTENPYGHFFIPKGWVVHHINQDKLDNRIENLIMLSQSKHMRLHHYLRGHKI